MIKTLGNCLLTNPVCGVILIVGVTAGNPLLAETTTAKVAQPLAAENLEKDLIISATRLNPLSEIQVANTTQIASNSLSNAEVMPVPAVSNFEPPSVGAISQSNQSVDSNSALSQVTSVSQLSDVQPTDWAFQALQSLVERYGCIAGYPDGTTAVIGR